MRRYPYLPYSLANSVIRLTSRGSSLGTCRSRRCVLRGWPITRQARRSDTRSRPSVSRACSTALRRFAGLRSFPRRPPSKWPCRVPHRPTVASDERSLFQVSSIASPGPYVNHHTPCANGSTSARSRRSSSPPGLLYGLEKSAPPRYAVSL